MGNSPVVSGVSSEVLLPRLLDSEMQEQVIYILLQIHGGLDIL